MQTPEEILKEIAKQILSANTNSNELTNPEDTHFYSGKVFGLELAKDIYEPLINEFNQLATTHQTLLDEVNRLNEVVEKEADRLRKIFEQHRLKHAKVENYARAQAIQDLMEDCGLYIEFN